MKKSSTSKALYLSVIATFLCVALLIGATFAWFSSTKTTSNNIIRTNNFEVEVKFYEEYIDPTSDAWKEFDEGTVFNDLVFVPGSEAVRYIKFENPNAFPVKFDLVLLRMDEALNTGLADSLLVYGKDGITGTVDYTNLNALAPNLQALNETAGYGEMAHMLQTVVAAGTSDAPGYGIAALSIRLPESFDDPNGMTATFKLRVIATQYVPVESTTSAVTATAAGPLTVTNDIVSVTIPNAEAGDAYELILSNKTLTDTEVAFDVQLLKNGASVIYEEGVTYTVEVNVGAGKTITSARHMDGEIDAWLYDSSTGILTYQVSTLSPFAIDYVEGDVIAYVGDTAYTTFDAAFAAAKAAGGTVTLNTNVGVDVEGYAYTVANGETVTIDLNGHALIGECSTGATSALIQNKGTLTIKDSTDTAKKGATPGKILYKPNPAWVYSNADPGGYASNAIRNEGTLTVESGSIVNVGMGSAAYAIDNYTAGKITITGGKVDTKAASTIRMFYNNGGALTVTGGVIGSYDSYMAVQVQGGGTNGVNITLSGGEFFGEYSIYAGGVAADTVSITGGTYHSYVCYGGSTTNFTVTGGTFEAWVGNWTGAKFIKGGTFYYNPTEDGHLCDSFEAFANQDGTWTVKMVIIVSGEPVQGDPFDDDEGFG